MALEITGLASTKLGALHCNGPRAAVPVSATTTNTMTSAAGTGSKAIFWPSPLQQLATGSVSGCGKRFVFCLQRTQGLQLRGPTSSCVSARTHIPYPMCVPPASIPSSMDKLLPRQPLKTEHQARHTLCRPDPPSSVGVCPPPPPLFTSLSAILHCQALAERLHKPLPAWSQDWLRPPWTNGHP